MFIALDQFFLSLFSALVCLLFLRSCLCPTPQPARWRILPLMPLSQIMLEVVRNSSNNTSSVHPAYSIKHTSKG